MMALLAQAAQTAANAPGDNTYVLWGFFLLAAALALLVLEVFVPSGGLIGVLCGIAALGSIISFFKYDPLWGTIALGLYILLTPIVIVFVFKMWLSSPMARWMILGGSEEVEEASEEASVASEQARRQRTHELRELIGMRGTAVSALRPVGTIKIEGRRVDAMAESGSSSPAPTWWSWTSMTTRSRCARNSRGRRPSPRGPCPARSCAKLPTMTRVGPCCGRTGPSRPGPWLR